MKPYEKYKDSGIEWVGKIPSHWNVSTVKRSLEFLNNKRVPLEASERYDRKGEYPYYGASGIIDYIDDYIFDGEHILIGEDGANILSRSTKLAFIAKGKFWVNNHAHILDVHNGSTSYFCEQLELNNFTNLASGSAQPKLTKDAIANLAIIVPPIPEQTQIAKYLVHQTAIIDELIAQKEQLITLLKQKRQAVINEAVTKGLNPNAKMKDSGIEWLGQVSEDWKIVKFKRLAKIRNGKDQKPVEIEEGGYPVLGTGGEFGRASEYLYDKPSVLLGRKGTIDKPQYVEEPFWTVDTLFYTEIREDCFPLFVFYLCQQIPFQLLQESSAVPSMTQDNLNNVFLCKPSFEEQKEICSFLEKKTNHLDILVEKSTKQIENLKEYRQSLISEAVTGKIDLRYWQPNE